MKKMTKKWKISNSTQNCENGDFYKLSKREKIQTELDEEKNWSSRFNSECEPFRILQLVL